MAENINIPVGQSAFTPGSIMPVKALTDASMRVAGIDSGLTNAPLETPSGVTPGKVVDLTEDKPKEEPTGSKDIKMCPGCGLILNETDEMKPTEIEKDQWLRHILGEPRFTQTYTLFGGRLAVTFRSRTTTENDVIFNQLTEEVKSGVISEFAGVMSPAYFTRMNRLMLGYSLVSIETRDKDAPMLKSYPVVTVEAYPGVDDKDDSPAVLRALERITTNRSEGQLSAIMVAQRRFESLIQTFMRHSDDPDFWNPIGADA